MGKRKRKNASIITRASAKKKFANGLRNEGVPVYGLQNAKIGEENDYLTGGVLVGRRSHGYISRRGFARGLAVLVPCRDHLNQNLVLLTGTGPHGGEIRVKGEQQL